MTSRLLNLFRDVRVPLLLVVGALLSPQQATAGCGDYVTVLNPTAESRSEPVVPPVTSGDPAKPPCSGPNCSRAPERHTPPVPPAPVVSAAKDLVSGAGLVVAEPPHTSIECTSPTAHPIRRPSSVFHPPRSV
jgi:hypothetical protein